MRWKESWGCSVTEQNYHEMLSQTAESILETMFFTVPLGPAEPETENPVVKARLAFHGNPSGQLEVCLSETCARQLASDFLGEAEETLTDTQPGEVVCELANMLCGSLVSKLEKREKFDLSSPEVLPVGDTSTGGAEVPPAACRSFALEHGILTVTLRVNAAA